MKEDIIVTFKGSLTFISTLFYTIGWSVIFACRSCDPASRFKHVLWAQHSAVALDDLWSLYQIVVDGPDPVVTRQPYRIGTSKSSKSSLL